MNGIMVSPEGDGRGEVGARPHVVIVSGALPGEMIDVEIPHGASVRILVEAAAARGGHAVEGLLVFVDDVDAPLHPDTPFDDGHPHHKRHHVHRHREIEVTVHYNADTAHERFSPSARIERVLKWAIGQFPRIDETLRTELSLKEPGDSPELPNSDNLGQHVRHGAHAITLDLTRGVIANGASS